MTTEINVAFKNIYKSKLRFEQRKNECLVHPRDQIPKTGCKYALVTRKRKHKFRNIFKRKFHLVAKTNKTMRAYTTYKTKSLE